jgi:hypothetical protein
MTKPQNAYFTTRLILGFCTLISIFLLFGMYALYNIHKVSDLSRTIYNHPLVVSNAALQAKVSIAKMHRSMKDVVLFNSISRIQKAIEAVNEGDELYINGFTLSPGNYLKIRPDISVILSQLRRHLQNACFK